MSLIGDIKTGILGASPISSVLRKAKVLAYQLKNQDFKEWVDFELNGYYGKDVDFWAWLTVCLTL